MATMAVSSTPLFTEQARLEVTQVEEQRVVHLNGHQVACYACEDRGTERVIATQLAEALPIKDMDIARSFGMHPVSLSRFKAQAREAGAAALMPKRLGPKGPSKLTAQLEKQIRELAGQELSCRAIAKRLCRVKRKISYGLVASVLKREQSQAQAPLAMELPARSFRPQDKGKGLCYVRSLRINNLRWAVVDERNGPGRVDKNKDVTLDPGEVETLRFSR